MQRDLFDATRRKPMSDFQAIADRVEIEALRGEFTDAVMMRDYDRGASLFTPDGVVRMPNVPVELAGREQIRAAGERLQGLWVFFVQNTHPGMIQLDGDTASGRAYISELGRFRDGRSELNYAVYHDRYQRTGDGWKFTERVYEVRYHDISPLAGSAPAQRGRPNPRLFEAAGPGVARNVNDFAQFPLGTRHRRGQHGTGREQPH
jgi:ketosteroid isomerase-like protein